MKKLTRVLGVLLAIFFGSVVEIYAQAGVIRGIVTDSNTEERLIGVNIGLFGTSLGNASTIDGDYVINRVPAGTYTIVASAIGYTRYEAEVVVVAGQTTTLNIIMNQEIVVGEEVVISAQAEGQIEAINQQLQSTNIVNVVSETRIQELPDFNAAAALGRLPGVSTTKSSGEDNKVVIRGLSPEFNSIEIEGIKLAATGSSQIGITSASGGGAVNNDRSVDLTMVSPYMIRMIAVYKSLTPDMNANSIGGTVNMELREAPDGLKMEALWQQGYTAKSQNYGNYRGVFSVSNRFLNNRLGLYALGNLESYDRDSDNLSANYNTVGDASTIDEATGFRPVEVASVGFNRHLETRNRFGANLILDYQLPKGSVKLINMFTAIRSDVNEYRQSINYDTGDLGWSVRLNDNSIDQQLNSLKLDYDFGFMSTDISVSYTSANNILDESPNFSFDQDAGVQAGQIRDNVLPEDLIGLLTYRGDEAVILTGGNLFSSDYKESKYDLKADFEIPFNLGLNVAGFIKLGGQLTDQTNSVNQETPYLGLTGGDGTGIQALMIQGISSQLGIPINSQGFFTGNHLLTGNNALYNSFLDNKFGQIYFAPQTSTLVGMIDYVRSQPQFDASNDGASTGAQGGWYDGPFQSLANDYEYSEVYKAGYAMAKLNAKDLMVIGGVRVEDLTTDYFAYNARDARNAQLQEMYDTTSTGGNQFVLPMVQAKYSPFDWMDVRYAYTETLARPNYTSISPKFTITQGNQVYTGNTNLKPAEAFNNDLSVTFHANKLGLLSVGVFHKKIKDFVYTTSYGLNAADLAGIDTLSNYQIVRDGDVVVTPLTNANPTVIIPINNPFDAIVKGLELDFQTNFWYLPKPFNSLVFGINYARISSETKYPFYKTEVKLEGRKRIPVLVDSASAGRLVNQPNHVLNSYLGYDYKDFSARISFLYQANSTVNTGGEFKEDDSSTTDYYKWDFSAKQKLPRFNSELFLEISNLTSSNSSWVQRTIGGFRGIQNYGLTGNFGIRIRY